MVPSEGGGEDETPPPHINSVFGSLWIYIYNFLETEENILDAWLHCFCTTKL